MEAGGVRRLLVFVARRKCDETDAAGQELGRCQKVFHVGEEGTGRALWCLQL